MDFFWKRVRERRSKLFRGRARKNKAAASSFSALLGSHSLLRELLFSPRDSGYSPLEAVGVGAKSLLDETE